VAEMMNKTLMPSSVNKAVKPFMSLISQAVLNLAEDYSIKTIALSTEISTGLTPNLQPKKKLQL
jgi:hypothetical protein